MSGLGEIAKLQGTDGDADQAKYFDAQTVKHTAYLAVLAFVQD